MTAMRRISGLVQFLIGFILGVGIFFGGVSLAGYLVFNRFATKPEKPVFSEEQPKTETTEAKKTADSKEEPAATDKKDSPKATATSSPAPTPKPTPSPSPTLPPNAYEAKVIWSGSVNVRAEPSKSSNPVTSVRYQDEVVVLETEGEWSKIRVGQGGPTGWLRSGNLEKIASTN